jgi:hypothetical protein
VLLLVRKVKLLSLPLQEQDQGQGPVNDEIEG